MNLILKEEEKKIGKNQEYEESKPNKNENISNEIETLDSSQNLQPRVIKPVNYVLLNGIIFLFFIFY